MSTTLIGYYPDDWVIVRWGVTSAEPGAVSVPFPLLCPRSVWDDPAQRAEFLRTRKIPATAPELRRVVSVKGVQVELPKSR